ncbi:cytochrome ubiquinol oxidase subunit I [Cupriavidus consociatus]|uniref:cytochrome ubiquinol oxidase subunit I n=1 Tax=Cupriavidus consociatus TaxID=2821357 RepID=UPI001AE89FDA|nr:MULTISPECIES: cytochrome ubiquinol oxidase subunit I [unclassified Cupriavidus]MBP0624442.1 cytochrome ubiquinol oxidase subunit I [Cupriavidus sp. LEh25]MDK2661153.1 cytochrome ubiquinol oxidase subunit I [Cupriavidus sp. LEh21]
MDPILLARMQFAANITFHILFPTISIGMGWLLLFFRWRYLASAKPVVRQAWLNAYRFWTKVFALTFALGVVSGITMSFQFGTNWPGFMETVGNIAGPLLAYEVLTAFFLEAGFLGVMLFGHGKVSERVHLMSTFFVAFGTTLSAFWILALNSWMQTPQGYEIVNGEFHVKSWAEVIFNPSFPYRLAHMLLASALTCAFLLAGLSAWQLLKGTGQLSAPRVLRVGLTLAAAAIPLQIAVGDMHGLNTLRHQPQKIAAMEGVWDTERGAPLLLFAIPDETLRTNHASVGVPKLASLILTHRLDGEIRGLNTFRDAHPPVLPMFFAFRVMVGVGVLMLAASWLGWWLYRRAGWQPQHLPRALLWGLAGMTFSGWIATVAGWYVTEVGRQPFIVHGLVRTADVASSVPAPHIALTLSLFVSVYLALIVAYVSVLKYLAEKPEETPASDPAQQPSIPSGAIPPRILPTGSTS